MKILLYLDNIKRFKISQIFFLIKNKLLKKFSGYFIGNSQIEFELRSLSANELKERLHKLFSQKDKNNPIWQIVESDKFNGNPFYLKLIKQLKKCVRNNVLDIDAFLIIDCEEIEEENNMMRFYLFAEAFNQFSLPDKERIKLILNFIEKDHFKKETWNGFNTALRLMNWLKIIYHLSEDFEINDSDWNKIQRSIRIHTYIIKNNIEYHIPGNHIFIQFYVIWLVAAIYSDEELLEYCHKMLKEETKKEFLENGFHFELSFHYHVQITLFLLLWIDGSRKFNQFIEKEIENIAKQATSLVNNFILPDNYIPMVGDNCYTFINATLEADIEAVKKIYLELFPEEKFYFEKRIIEINNNYIISNRKDSKLIFDVGNLGLYENPGHGHADLLNIIYFDKVPIFVDPGTKRYGNNYEDMLLKRTSSHNTITINDFDQAKIWGFFRWSYLPRTEPYTISSGEDYTEMRAGFQGFKECGNLMHFRTVRHCDGMLKLVDEIDGKGVKDIELNFILHPLIKPEISQNTILLKSENYAWIMQFDFKQTINIQVNSFSVFEYYNSPSDTLKISISVKKYKLPFTSTIILLRLQSDEI